MNDRPTGSLVKAMNGALKEWFHALRGLHRGRIRRGAAAAAAVTLAAGMTAAPALAALPDPSSDNQPQAGSPREGVQVAQNGGFARPVPRPAPVPRPGPGPVPPEQQSPFDPAQPARPGRVRAPEVGPPPPEGLIQPTPGMEDLLRAAEDVNNYKDFTQEQQDAALALARIRQQLMDRPITWTFPGAEFFESVPPGPRNEGPSLLPSAQRQAINRQLAKDGVTEPMGYLNPYDPRWAIGPAKEASYRLAGDRQWLKDQLQASELPTDTRNKYQVALNDILLRISHAENQDERNALIDQFNSLKDDFNRAELTYRDDNHLFGLEGRKVPRNLDPGLPEPAPENLRDARAALEATEQQQALKAAREHALEPGVMNGGDVNTGTPDTDPGSVGGDGQDDPAKGTTDAINQGRITDTDPNQANDTPGDATDDPSADNSQTNPGVENTVDQTTTVDGDKSSPEGESKSSDDSQNGTDTSSDADTGASKSSSTSESDSDSDAGETGTASEGSDVGGDDSAGGYGGGDSGDSGSYGGGSTSYGGSDSSGDGSSSSSGDGGGSSSSGGDGGSSSGGA